MGTIASPAVTAALAELAQRLRARFGDRLVSAACFGSFARGEANAASDVDVCVVLDAATWNDQRAVLDLAADIALEHDVPLSPTVFPSTTYRQHLAQERRLVLDIEREGIPL